MFPKASAFTTPGEHPGIESLKAHTARMERQRKAEEQVAANSTLIANDQLERWYDRLNRLAADLSHDGTGVRSSHEPLLDEIEDLRDEVYRYLRG